MLTKEETQIIKDAADLIKREILAEPLTETPVKLPVHGFGVFKTHMTKERIGRNPKTGEPVTIPAKRAVKFSASKTWL